MSELPSLSPQEFRRHFLWAAEAGDTEKAAALLEVTSQPPAFSTYLWVSLLKGHLELAAYLASQGAALFAPIFAETDPALCGLVTGLRARNGAIVALARGNEVAHALLDQCLERENANIGEVLGLAVSQSKIDEFDRLLQRWPYPHATFHDNPLIAHAVRAYKYGHIEVLLRHGADPNAICISYPQKAPVTILIEAAQRSNPKILQQLLTAGADPNLRASTGVCALAVAVQSRSVYADAVAAALLEAGAQLEDGHWDAGRFVQEARRMQRPELAARLEAHVLGHQVSEAVQYPRRRM